LGRVDTVSRSEQEYEKLADRHIDLVLEGIKPQPEWTIVELGCGVGRLISRLLQRPASLFPMVCSGSMSAEWI
jgi:16S rRNA A1518/A1519 N6-dimethyltransferase RsmA/KsgA/DIM1 with predicted DNA glycosylase/AP lyase activity